MKVLDFISEQVDRMNEQEFFATLDALADAYAAALNEIGIYSGDIHENALLSGFLLQEIVKQGEGRYVFAKAPTKSTLKLLHTMVALD